MTDDLRTALGLRLAAGLSLAEATLDVARCQQPDRRRSAGILGPQHDAVVEVLGRLEKISEEGVHAAEHSAAVSWGLSDREPNPYVLRRAMSISGQPSEEVLAVLDVATSVIVAVHEPADRVLTLGLHAVAGAHLLTAADWGHWTRPLVAAIGSVPYPSSELTVRVLGCGLPVGSHLFWTWTATGHSCSCQHQFPGLSDDGTRIAKTLAEQATDWASCLRVARILDRHGPAV